MSMSLGLSQAGKGKMEMGQAAMCTECGIGWGRRGHGKGGRERRAGKVRREREGWKWYIKARKVTE
jgi:hypothetical protein